MMKKILSSLLILLMISQQAFAATYYVRTPALGASQDGGTGYDATYNPTGQCNGTTNAAYSGSGTNQNCAYNSPMWALSWKDGSYPQKMIGGDTLIINGDAYIGFNADGNSFASTSSSYPWDAYMKAIPSGPDPSHPTKIYGVNYASCTRTTTTKLIGKERVEKVLNLEGSNNIEIKCLTITQGIACGELHDNAAVACQRSTYPYGDWAKNGISAVDSANVYLERVYVEGLASRGLLVGRLQDWHWKWGDISGNTYAGWDNDRGDPDNWANGGTITIEGTADEKFEIWWNGCVNLDPHNSNPVNASCFTQGQGPGYGDGWSISDKTGSLGGANYVFKHVDYSKNTSDGMDNLYKANLKTTTVEKSKFAHNNGNAIKIAGTATLNDVIASGDCDFFNGKAFTYTGDGGFTHCRAGGNTVAWDVQHTGDTLDIFDSDITGKGDVLIQTSGASVNCNGTEHVKARNVILQGDDQYGGGDTTDDYYNSGATGNGDGNCASIAVDWSVSGAGNIIYAVKNADTGAGISNANPLFTDKYADWAISVTSPARGIRNASFGNTIDFNGYTRGTASGALEYGSTSASATCDNTCSLCGSSGTCVASAASCHWWSTSTCNATTEGPICANTCSQCANSSTCGASAATCYWWANNTCNSTPDTTPTCSTTCSLCSTQTPCQASAATCYWWNDSTCHSTQQGSQTNFTITGRCSFVGKAVPK